MCSVLYLHEYEVSIPPPIHHLESGVCYMFVHKVEHVQVMPFPETMKIVKYVALCSGIYNRFRILEYYTSILFKL